jgi:hypothetical protein
MHLIHFYEQKYFTHDKEILFKENLYVHPVLVKDYYSFYASLGSIKLNKNETMEGISMNDLGYLLWYIENNEENGRRIFANLMQLLEIIFRISNGRFCPKCGHVITYDEINDYMTSIKEIKDPAKQEEAIQNYIQKVQICEHCSSNENIVERQDVIRYVNESGNKNLFIYNTSIDNNEYVLLKNIIFYYNIPDYDDTYIDPELEKELAEVARLKNPNNVQPSLEKQMCCILSANSAYTFETIQEISIRKFVLLLRTIDARLHYFAYRQGELSGMVKFSKEIDHWIYGSDKKNKYDELMSLDSFKDKLKDVI